MPTQYLLSELLTHHTSDDFYTSARIDLQYESGRLATTTNDLGEFRFDNMPSGEMRLEITFPDYHVVGYFMVHDQRAP